MENIYQDAGRLMVEELQKLIKKIPKRGLNNMTKPKYLDGFGFHTSENGSLWSIPSEPTLPKRMSKLWWGLPYLPPQMVAMGATQEDHKENAKQLLNECFDLLDNLYENLDDVTVLDRRIILRYQHRINELKSYLRTLGKILGTVQETSFEIINV